jgi:hypothetical protein
MWTIVYAKGSYDYDYNNYSNSTITDVEIIEDETLNGAMTKLSEIIPKSMIDHYIDCSSNNIYDFIEIIKVYEYTCSLDINIEETPVYFDMIKKRKVEIKIENDLKERNRILKRDIEELELYLKLKSKYEKDLILPSPPSPPSKRIIKEDII